MIFNRLAGLDIGPAKNRYIIKENIRPALAATRFRVENTTFAGEKIRKNNCNFFRLRGEHAIPRLSAASKLSDTVALRRVASWHSRSVTWVSDPGYRWRADDHMAQSGR